MKIIKPDNISLLCKTHVLEAKHILTISSMIAFNFKLDEPRLLSESDLWKTVQANLSKHETLDSGFPKPLGEYLIYGKAYSNHPVKGIGIYASVGELAKPLVVIGNRYWNTLGASSPKEFTSINVNYANAFGGLKYEYNPIGKGCNPNSEGIIELPNIEDPNQPITKKSDKHFPAGFSAYPIGWPQRTKYLGPITNNYLKESWPHLPKGTDPEFFNTAPLDQRLKGFFNGNENFTIKNMHPTNSMQNSKLPGLRTRVFLTRQDVNNQESIQEVPTNIETLWLFPNNEVGVLLYRGSININEKEYKNLKQLYAVLESLNETPKSAEFYLQQILNNTVQPVEVAKAEEISNPSAGIETMPAITQEEESILTKDHTNASNEELENALKELEEIKVKFQKQLEARGVSLDEEVDRILNKPKNTPKESPDMEQTLKELQQHNAQFIKKHNLTEGDLNKVLGKTKRSINQSSIGESLEQLKKSGTNLSAEIEDNLMKLDELVKQMQVEAAKPEAQMNMDNPELERKLQRIDQILTHIELTRNDIIDKYNLDKDLSNLDLSNLDLSNLDLDSAQFNNSILENTNFAKSKLNKAIFINARLTKVNFHEASLNEAKFEQSYAANANFSNTTLIKSHIKHSDLTNADFEKANLDNAVFDEVVLEQGNLSNVFAPNSFMDRSMLNGCNLTNANFSDASFKETNLSSANLEKTNLARIIAPGLKLNGAIGNFTNFEFANLQNSRADVNTCLNNANLQGASLINGAWSGANLTQANLTQAIMDQANFSNTKLTKSKLELVSAKNTNFTEANFANSDLNRINLFKGSLRSSNLSKVDLRYSNLYAVDFYKAVLNKTNFTGSNLDQTLFAALEISTNELSKIE